MTITSIERNRLITVLLNSTYTSIKSVVPINYQMSKPSLLDKTLNLQFGVLIGVTGGIKGRIILAGEPAVFGSIGEMMFGMNLEGEMLASFSGELGNMLAGRISTTIVENGIKTDITAPTIMEGDTTLSGSEKAIKTTAAFDDVGDLDIYLLLD